jgi:hypothetical protein
LASVDSLPFLNSIAFVYWVTVHNDDDNDDDDDGDDVDDSNDKK